MCSVLDFKYILSNSNCILAVYVKNLVMYKHRSVPVIEYSFSDVQLSCCNFCDFKHQLTKYTNKYTKYILFVIVQF